MTYTEQAIKKAYPNQTEMFSPNWGIECYLLSPDFWYSLGNALGWTDLVDAGDFASSPEWCLRWHSLVDHLIEGRLAEEFFRELLN